MKVESERLALVKDYADFKKVSTTAVYGWIAQGKIESTKIGKFTFVILEKDEVEEYKAKIEEKEKD